ncbi:MAG: hypothetical protein JRI68_28555 [Deltaproteobacteria bacterium]|nr:hypothetical protein [Deltaproteobacteria bacterium]
MSQFELQAGEVGIDSWTINYLPPDGGRFTGELLVTNQRLLFDATFDTSVTGALQELIIVSGSHGYLAIPKSAIQGIEVKSSFFKKKVIVTLQNGQHHTFDYGMLSVTKLAAAIEQR